MTIIFHKLHKENPQAIIQISDFIHFLQCVKKNLIIFRDSCGKKKISASSSNSTSNSSKFKGTNE